jgi:predicted nucleotidyltransferase
VNRRITRQEIIDAVSGALRDLPFARAAWLGGSDATGRTDRWSDVDLMVLVEDGRVEETFSTVFNAVTRLSPISHRHRMPRPPGQDYDQVFLNLRDADDCHMVDMVVLTDSSEERFLERERHGEPLVLFDRAGVVRAVPLDRDRHLERMRGRLASLRETFPLFQNLVIKSVRRGVAVEAVYTYLVYTIRPLIELLRMRYCPDRFDYGPRYLDRDLPPRFREEIERLSLPSSLTELEGFHTRAEELFRETMAELSRGELA